MIADIKINTGTAKIGRDIRPKIASSRVNENNCSRNEGSTLAKPQTGRVHNGPVIAV